jgi:hypothetical protein
LIDHLVSKRELAMDDLKIYLKARGQYFKLLLGALIFAAAAWGLLHAPKSYSHKVMKKTVVVKLSYLPDAMESIMGLSVIFMAYTALRQKVTKVEAGRVNLAYTHGLFDRRKDAVDITGVQDFTIDCNPFDWLLQVRTFIVYARSKTDPHLVIHGMGKKDAEQLFEHLTAYSNRSIVKYVQSQADRNAYRNKHQGDGVQNDIEPKESPRGVRNKLRGSDDDENDQS